MFQKNETCKALKECYLMSNIPKRNLASGCHLLKKIDQPSPQIVCISSRFRVLHLFSWEFERSEVLWRYADILLCYLKHVEVCWYTRKKKRRIRKPWLNARKHWESESRNRNLSAAVLHVKPSRRNSNLYDSRENHHKVEILNYSVSLQYSKWNRDFITVNF